MQYKKHTSSKKNTGAAQNSNLIQQYKSQSKLSQQSIPSREGFAFQNMKQFKCQIDHQIAKCLDTLDRQGLKFLKETLRASKLFGLNTQEPANTQSIEQNISSLEEEDQVIEKSAQIVKKIEPAVKSNVQIKKVKKIQPPKKTIPAKVPTQHPQHTEEKTDMNQRIIKKLQSLNIKTAKKSQNAKSIKKQLPNLSKNTKPQVKTNIKYIQEQIEEQLHKQQESHPSQQQSIIQQEIKMGVSNLKNNESPVKKQLPANFKYKQKQKQKEKQKQKSKNEQVQFNLNQSPYQQSQSNRIQMSRSKVQEQPSNRYPKHENHTKTQQSQHLKPFYKKQFKKYPTNHEQIQNIKQIKDHNIQISKQDDLNKIVTQQQSLKQQILPEIVLTGNQQYNSLNIQKQENSYNQSSVKHSDPYMQSLINKINKLSPTKRNKLEKILDKLEDSEKMSDPSLLSTSKIQENFILPFLPQKPMVMLQVQQKQKLQKSKSRSRLQKKQEKATSLKNSLVKKPFNSNVMASQNEKKQDQLQSSINLPPSSNKKQSQKANKNTLQLYQIAKSQLMPASQRNNSNFNNDQYLKNYQTTPPQLKNSLNIIQESNRSELGTKLIKISKKKSQITNLTINLISNHGHNSLIGLNSIQIYDLNEEIIKIDESHLRQSNNNKVFKLFNENGNNGDGWLTNLTSAWIKIENVAQIIGGIRINNWNRSQLQADRQTDLAELLVNDQLYWRGQLKGGSYKQDQVYSTDIKITQKPFSFPTGSLKNSSQLKIKTEEDSSPMLKNNLLINASAFKKMSSIQKSNNEACWLQKEDLQKKMKEIQDQQRKVTQIKKIHSIRSSNLNIPNDSKLQFNTQIKDQYKPIHFNSLNIRNHEDLFKNNNDDLFKNNQSIRFPEKNNKSNIRSSLNQNDILGTLKKSVNIKKRKEDQPSAFRFKKDDQMKKQREQDEEFQKILKGLEKPEAQKIQPVRIQKNIEKPSQNIVKKQKKAAQLSFEQFMKDSLFDEKPKSKNFQQNIPKQRQLKIFNKQQKFIPQQFKKNNKIDIDNLIDELNDVVGLQNNQQTGQQFYIPQLPKGKQLTFIMLSNWGHQNLIGINGIQIIDSQGNNLKDLVATSSNFNHKQLNSKLFKNELLTSDEKNQLKCQKNKRISLTILFSQKVQIALIRIWNYNGHRVRNNIGIKKCHIKFDGNYIFSGEIQSSSGSLEDSKKNSENILFTQNLQILKKIKEKDWLSKIKSKVQEEKQLFKTTIKNFFRPPTRNDDENPKKMMEEIEINKKQIKLPKRNCFEYDPPQIPEGFVLKFILHNGWGDRFFIGLNGIQVYNEKGENITNKNLSQIRADPSSISKLQGYERDKRVINNLINGKHNTTSDNNIWLAPFLSDVQKVQKGRANTIIMDYSKSNKISAINIYNYIKTPERGVRQIQIFLDNMLLYRGYLRRYNPQQQIIHTTINFTKQQHILQMVNYMGYNEDNLQQEVGLVNEQKTIRSVSIANTRSSHQLLRPMTGKLFE